MRRGVCEASPGGRPDRRDAGRGRKLLRAKFRAARAASRLPGRGTSTAVPGPEGPWSLQRRRADLHDASISALPYRNADHPNFAPLFVFVDGFQANDFEFLDPRGRLHLDFVANVPPE